METNSALKWIIIVVVCLVMITGIGGTYYFYDQANKEKSANQKMQTELNLTKAELEKSQNEVIDLKKTGSNTTAAAANTCITEQLSSDQKDMSSDWVPFVHNNVNYTFKYPQSWTMKSVEAEMATFEYAKDSIDFRVRSGKMAEIGFEMDKVSSKNIKIACQDAVETVYATDKLEMVVSSFKKGDTPYLAMISFEDKGASYSGDIIDQYETILKTMNFSQ
jgi:hypothetical protein